MSVPSTPTPNAEIGKLREERDRLITELESVKTERDLLTTDLKQVKTEHERAISAAATVKGERDKLATEIKAAQNKIRELHAQLSLVERERDRLAAQRNEQPFNTDLEALRDRILANLKLGKQAPGYKASYKALDLFIAELKREPK